MNDAKNATKEFRLEQWRKIIQDRMDSGLFVDDYCEQHNLSRNSYYYWLRKIRQDLISKQAVETMCQENFPAESTIVELKPSKMKKYANCGQYSNQSSFESKLELSVEGATLTVFDSTSDDLLFRVLKAVHYAK